MEKRYQVFVSSTFMDLEKEREIAVQTLMKMDCIPSGMELFPAADIEQFDFIKKVIDDCDYYLLIIGGKYGSMTEEGISYTEKEYDYALEKGIKVIAFLHKFPENLPAKNSETTSEAIEKLKKFREKVAKGRLVEFWENKDQLAGMVALGLISLKKMHPAIGWVRANQTSTIESLGEINSLRKKNNELEEQVKKLNISYNRSSGNTGKLAKLSSLISIDIIDNSTKEIILSREVTWFDILSRISGLLFSSISEYYVSELIKDLCLEDNKNIKATYSNSLSLESINKIKIQFYALGFIDFDYEIDRDDDESYIVWLSTESGKKAILDLVAIKDEIN
tara:strand:+ start:217 stop:1221 length:1005 start_codon:yes stop_codon:yes gene_type:complete